GEAEIAEDEFPRERVQQRLVGAEIVGDERAARAPVPVGNLQASRVVYQNAEEVLLRHRGFENQSRTEQTEDDHAENRQPERDEDRAVAAAAPRNAAIAQERVAADQGCGGNREQHRTRHAEDEITLLEEQRRVLEEKTKE